MANDDTLPLFKWQPPCKVIAFPADKRRGHAFKIANQLAKARTNKEADWTLTRALVSYQDKLMEAGVSPALAKRHVEAFERLIWQRCVAIGSKWAPTLDDAGNGGGAA